MSTTGGFYSERGLALLRQFKPNVDALIRLLRRRPRPEPAPEVFPRTARVLLVATVTLVTVVPVMTVAADVWSANAARTLPAVVRVPFGVITEFGWSGWILWPVGIALILMALLTSPPIGRIGVLVVTAISVRLTFLFAAVALPGLFVAIVKRLIGRARPHVNAAADPNVYDPFVWKAAYTSLPSGHATTAFAAAVAFGALWPRARPYLWTFALLIALSRVVVFVHYPSDVVVGAVVGVVGAVLVRNWFAARGLAFAIGSGGRVHTLPGPSMRRLKAVAARLLPP